MRGVAKLPLDGKIELQPQLLQQDKKKAKMKSKQAA